MGGFVFGSDRACRKGSIGIECASRGHLRLLMAAATRPTTRGFGGPADDAGEGGAMVQILERRGAFRAYDEAGEVLVVHRYEGPEGLVLVADRGGTPVRRVDRGHYELAGPRPGRLWSKDPSAP